MVVLALVLLILVLLFSVAIVLSNPDVYQLSLFRVLVPVTSAGVFFTGFGAALVTIVALLLLRTGIRRSRETRQRLRAADESTADRPTAALPDRTDGPTDDEPDPSPTPDRRSTSTLDLEPGEEPRTASADREPVNPADDRDRPRL